MKIWIDLANSPHVLFFEPIVEELARQGHEVIFSARDFAQTVRLAQQKGMFFTTIGRNDHKALGGKGRQLADRAFGLARFAWGHRFDLAVSHNSYAQIMAAALLRIPAVTLMDYEHQPANHIAFRLAGKVIVPEALPAELLAELGARPPKLRTYDGLKEDVYLAGFEPGTDFRAALGVPEGAVMATVRPPAFSAIYHRFDNPLFDTMLQRLTSYKDVYTVISPRGDAAALKEQYDCPRVRVLDVPVDGKNLIYHSDLVVSGGGTMNREAAVLGTPAYTIFAGRLGAVDRMLIESNRLALISKEADFDTIRLKKKKQAPFIGRPELARQLVKEILA